MRTIAGGNPPAVNWKHVEGVELRLLPSNLASLTSFSPSSPPPHLTQYMQLHKRVLQKCPNHSEVENVLKIGYVCSEKLKVAETSLLLYSMSMFAQKYQTKKPQLQPRFECAVPIVGKNTIYHLLNKNIKNKLRFCLTRKGLTKWLTRCCHPKPRPPSPSVSGDISLFLYRK